MLLNLHVRNIALLDEVEIDFTKGLNILSGETGAGKSLIIDSVNFALGKKMPKDIVRDDAEYALCELTFSVDSEELMDEIKRREVPMFDDTVIMQRKIMNGRSIARVNGETVSSAKLKEIATLFIDIHGQHEHQSLLYKKKHREILDEYAGEEMSALISTVAKEYEKYTAITRELEAAIDLDSDKDKKIDLANYEIEEIQNANLAPGEDEEIEAEYQKLANSNKIAEAVAKAHALSGYEENGAGGNVGRALNSLNMVSDFDSMLGDMVKELADIENLLNDFNRSIAAYESELDRAPEKFAEISERLDLINRLKSKYGDTIDEINEYLKKQQELVEKFNHYEEYIKELENKKEALYNKLLLNCNKISALRKKTAGILENKLKEALLDLNFLDVRFEISVNPDVDNLSAFGIDDVEFLISTNPGEAIKPLSTVASGGELSRIMLAIKSVIADKDNVSTLIFDEIDTGISGRTAQKVSVKLKELALKHQVICITHLPQIAAMADTHYEILKEVVSDKTRTIVKMLDDDESVKELARMLGGVEITNSVMNSAKEMKQLAKKIK